MTTRRHLVAAIISVTSVLLGTTSAKAVDQRVQAACSGDYSTYCGQHDRSGPSARACMRAYGEKLRPTCVDALIMAGEITRKEVEARRAKKAR